MITEIRTNSFKYMWASVVYACTNIMYKRDGVQVCARWSGKWTTAQVEQYLTKRGY